jgi:sugar phosphate permease
VNPTTAWLGLMFLALGVFGILDATGILDSSQTIGQWWPVAIIGWPLAEMLTTRRVSIGGIICVAVGFALLADEQAWAADTLVWSSLAVFIGVILMYTARRREPDDAGDGQHQHRASPAKA